jgi:hypothetical protein
MRSDLASHDAGEEHVDFPLVVVEIRDVVRWSDGRERDACRWYRDEVLICEGDLIGKTREQLQSLHFRRDGDWLQS